MTLNVCLLFGPVVWNFRSQKKVYLTTNKGVLLLVGYLAIMIGYLFYYHLITAAAAPPPPRLSAAA